MSNHPYGTIELWKTEAGLPTAEIARCMHASRSTVSRLEQHPENARLKDIIRYAEACGVDEPVLRLQRRKHPSEILMKNFLRIKVIFDKYAQYGFTNPRIYGSVARGEDTADSGIEFVVDCDQSPERDPQKKLELRYELSLVLQVKFDLAVYQDMPSCLKESVDKEALALNDFCSRQISETEAVYAVDFAQSIFMKPSELLRAKSGEIRGIIAKAALDGINNFRIFGSVSRDEDTEDSDVDVLVDCRAGNCLMKTGFLIEEFQRVLHIHVDVMAEQQLKGNLKSILDDARPIDEFLE